MLMYGKPRVQNELGEAKSKSRIRREHTAWIYVYIILYFCTVSYKRILVKMFFLEQSSDKVTISSYNNFEFEFFHYNSKI